MKILNKQRVKDKNITRVINMNKRVINHLGNILNLVFISWMLLLSASVYAVDLRSLDYSVLPGEKVQLVLMFSEPIDKPTVFSIDEPARAVLDFAGVSNKLDRKTQQINVGVTQSVSVVESDDRTRVVLNMVKKAPYTIEQDGNNIIITVGGGSQKVAVKNDDFQVTDIGFRRFEAGGARLTIALSNDNATVDIHQEGDVIVLDLIGVSLPEKLHRRLDVVDFATPVQIINSVQQGNNTQIMLSTKGKFEHLSYQSDRQLIVEVKPVEEEALSGGVAIFGGYSGKKLSLSFQDIEVRSVLQILADFTGVNLVTSDTVQGSITLNLKNVPWDHALDIILKIKGLGLRQNGNVMFIAPAEEIAARERQELEAKKQRVELEALYSEIIELNFAKVDDIITIIGAKQDEDSSLLSSRGSAIPDQRTNSLLLRDTAQSLVQIRRLIKKLDMPVRQVLIESRVVVANNDFSKALGVRFGASANVTGGTDITNKVLSGSLSGTEQLINGEPLTVVSGNNTPDRLNVDLPVQNPSGSIALALAKLPFGAILELELSAMQEEGVGEVVSSPRVITSNQSTAIIEQGIEIPYQEASSSGATSVSFKKAVLKLQVTPQITPDDRVIMDLQISNDSRGPVVAGVPSINTENVETEVLVDNGETVVLGGIYKQTTNSASARVPFFGDLPVIGFLFKRTTAENDKSELLIFVTPKIIKDSLKF